MPTLAVIIVNYNTRDLLDNCLATVFASRTSHDYRVLVVDNSSSDGSAQMVAERYPRAELISSDRNGGFGYANNLALRLLSATPEFQAIAVQSPPATLAGPPAALQPASEIPVEGASSIRLPCDYVLFLNPDTELPQDALDKTVAFLDANRTAGVVGPKVVKPDGSLDLACRRSFPTPSSSFFKLTGLSKLFPGSRALARYNLTYLDDEATAEVDSVMGAYMLVRARALEDAGLFDERFFMYGEDLDLAYRIKSRGWKVFYYPEITVLHHKGASSRKQSERSIRQFYSAMHIFYRKHYASRYNSAVNLLITFAITSRGVLALVQNALRPAEHKRVT